MIDLDLTSSQNRAIFIASVNAFLNYRKLARATVHCKDEDPEVCAQEIATTILLRCGKVDLGLIGLNPAIAERLIEVFGVARVRITDLNHDTIGQHRFGVEIWDGSTRTEELIDASDMILLTGTALVNGTFDAIANRIRNQSKDWLVYGVTAAGVCELLGIERICPRGRDGLLP